MSIKLWWNSPKKITIWKQGQQSTTIYWPSWDTAWDTIIYSWTATDSWTYTFSADVRAYVSWYYGCLDININWTTVETFSTDSMSYVSFSYDTQIEVWDTIQLHLYWTQNQYWVCNNVQIINTITTLVEKDIKRVTIRPSIKDTQWPCANGYHVPSREENVALVDAMTTLGIDTSTWACMKTYLKMPYAWYRNYTNSNAAAQSTAWRYWACTRLNARTTSTLAFGATFVTPQSNANTSYGFSIRPFKNETVIPDSTWTTLFDWSLIATNAWIFHNTTDGIISISADWTNWITIADKNLWATVVYNDGDTLAETNCWWYFQWWNNYMFPFTWTVTTSSTQVDASNYWPWNWYSSSTFITWNPDWSSVQNDNLRWEAVWVLTEKQIRPVWWQPWANTIAYYPLTADTNDHSWNNRNLTNSWVTFVNNIYWATVPVWYFNWSSRAYRNWVEQLNTWYTISLWGKSTSTVNNTSFIFDMRNDNQYWQWMVLITENWYFKARQQKSYNSEEEYARIRDNNWNHWVLTWTGSVWTVYFNWVQVKQASIANSINTSNSTISLWSRYSGNTNNLTGYISEFIVEDKTWTAQEISDYFNQTKSLYGIS